MHLGTSLDRHAVSVNHLNHTHHPSSLPLPPTHTPPPPPTPPHSTTPPHHHTTTPTHHHTNTTHNNTTHHNNTTPHHTTPHHTTPHNTNTHNTNTTQHNTTPHNTTTTHHHHHTHTTHTHTTHTHTHHTHTQTQHNTTQHSTNTAQCTTAPHRTAHTPTCRSPVAAQVGGVTPQGLWLIVVDRTSAVKVCEGRGTCTRRMVLYRVCTHLSRALRPPILDNGGVVFGGGAGFSSMLESAVGPSVCLILDLPCSSRKLFRVAVRCFLLRVSPFSAEGEAEVHRAVAEACLRGTSSASLLLRRMRLFSLQDGRFPRQLLRRRNLRGQPVRLILGKGLSWRTLSMWTM